MKTVFVVGKVWKFRVLLRAQLREEGWGVRGFETLREVAEELERGSAWPAALVFDTTDADPMDREQLEGLAERLPVLVVAAAQEPFDFAQGKPFGFAQGKPVDFARGKRFEVAARGARGLRILRRPLRLAEIVEAVKKLTVTPH